VISIGCLIFGTVASLFFVRVERDWSRDADVEYQGV